MWQNPSWRFRFSNEIENAFRPSFAGIFGQVCGGSLVRIAQVFARVLVEILVECRRVFAEDFHQVRRRFSSERARRFLGTCG
jgi:hypothetical protein